MTNEQIIANVAISEGIFTEEEVEAMIEAGKELPLHTLQGWSARGKRLGNGKTYKLKKGEHGIETRLWKKKDKNYKSEDESSDEEGLPTNRDFYLAKSFLFRADQVEIIEMEE